jgi:hypothetical protein
MVLRWQSCSPLRQDSAIRLPETLFGMCILKIKYLFISLALTSTEKYEIVTENIRTVFENEN